MPSVRHTPQAIVSSSQHRGGIGHYISLASGEMNIGLFSMECFRNTCQSEWQLPVTRKEEIRVFQFCCITELALTWRDSQLAESLGYLTRAQNLLHAYAPGEPRGTPGMRMRQVSHEVRQVIFQDLPSRTSRAISIISSGANEAWSCKIS